MVSIEQAQRSILASIPLLETETVSVFHGLNRITTQDQVAPWDLPAADNSAMDGFAFAHQGLQPDGRLKVTGFLPAGEIYPIEVPFGEAVRIMTGAALPAGCDTVAALEDVIEEKKWIRLSGPVRRGTHVRNRGEDIEKGKVIIPAGTLLRPQEIGMLAAMGVSSLPVHRRARVAVLATGDELLELGATPTPGKLINSNSYSLAAQVLDAAAEPVLLGIAPDTLQDTCDKIQAGLKADLVVITGGVSAGDRDYVRPAIEALGGTLNFWKVDMKPGKPVAFGLVQEIPVFALPGNPVAAMVAFELFVRPSLLKAMGHRSVFRPTIRAALQEPVSNRGKRPHLIRGLVSAGKEEYLVSSTGNQSSARLSSLIQGNGLIRLAPERSYLPGESVQVMLLDRNFELGCQDI